MAKIYSLVVENDRCCGSETLLFYTEAERNARALAIVTEEWDADLGPMPDDWREAYEAANGAVKPGRKAKLSQDVTISDDAAERFAETFSVAARKAFGLDRMAISRATLGNMRQNLVIALVTVAGLVAFCAGAATAYAFYDVRPETFFTTQKSRTEKIETRMKIMTESQTATIYVLKCHKGRRLIHSAWAAHLQIEMETASATESICAQRPRRVQFQIPSDKAAQLGTATWMMC